MPQKCSHFEKIVSETTCLSNYLFIHKISPSEERTNLCFIQVLSDLLLVKLIIEMYLRFVFAKLKRYLHMRYILSEMYLDSLYCFEPINEEFV